MPPVSQTTLPVPRCIPGLERPSCLGGIWQRHSTFTAPSAGLRRFIRVMSRHHSSEPTPAWGEPLADLGLLLLPSLQPLPAQPVLLWPPSRHFWNLVP